ncbi:small ribosomal subunit protein mS38 [Ahaetulla prasina]|uniref:small ribosomal subunit protein mS38 n=1 Tax=Ahaetulla prasina TaxID=499056 RepID=UPI002647ED3B|nr:small ribosomal subunit protein mS38 [Ahaetulla prasina]XP_058017376.1 small ribosomal subunit protein mS38 [Ahaetulla prasina]
MLVSRLTGPLVRASRCAGCFPLRPSVVLPPPRATVLASYSTHPSSKNGTRPNQWFTFDPELEEMLVPRKMSISPLESWLTVQYFLPKNGGIINVHERNTPRPLQQYDLPAPSRGTEAEEEEEAEQSGEMNRPRIECRNILKIRRRKMNRHKYKKLMKRTKFLRRKVMEKRMWRKQKKFENELKRMWKKAGLKNPPEGWVTPKIYLRNVKS